jgi:hypothetical protein
MAFPRFNFGKPTLQKSRFPIKRYTIALKFLKFYILLPLLCCGELYQTVQALKYPIAYSVLYPWYNFPDQKSPNVSSLLLFVICLGVPLAIWA